MSIQNNAAVDVAIFYTTKDAESKGKCFMSNSLQVLGINVMGNVLTVNSDGYNGSIICVPIVDASESSLAFCNYKDMRFAAAADMWLMGQHSWYNVGYSIGTQAIGMCLTIADNGNTNIPHDFKTPGINVDRVKALTLEYLTLDDTILITGSTIISGNIITRIYI